jgi:hypothetical protein
MVLLIYVTAYFQVLNQLCDVIVEQLRDRVVTGLLQACLVITLATSFRTGFHNSLDYVLEALLTGRMASFV